MILWWPLLVMAGLAMVTSIVCFVGAVRCWHASPFRQVDRHLDYDEWVVREQREGHLPTHRYDDEETSWRFPP